MIIHTTTNAGYLPQPNRIEAVASEFLAPSDLITTAFMIPLTLDGRVVMANNRRRGLEFPGGHVEPGETAFDAAIRECGEETGYHVSSVKPIGYLRMISEGPPPAGYAYPHPESYQQFFTGRVLSWSTYEENDECLAPVEVSLFDAVRTFSDQRVALLIQAIRRF